MVVLQVFFGLILNIALDIGNSSIKLGLFEGQELQLAKRFEVIPELQEFLKSNPGNMIISSVAGEDQDMLAAYNPLILDSGTPLPVTNRYATPETLGMDRLAAAVGANVLYPDRNCLVVDAGTAINYELVTSEGDYLGGAISPGISMRFKALNNYTANLPLLTDSDETKLVGDSTKTSIESGVLNGIVAEVDGMINHYSESYSDLVILMCGGDAPFFETRLKAPIFVDPNLVLRGLNGILNYNEDRS